MERERDFGESISECFRRGRPSFQRLSRDSEQKVLRRHQVVAGMSVIDRGAALPFDPWRGEIQELGVAVPGNPDMIRTEIPAKMRGIPGRFLLARQS